MFASIFLFFAFVFRFFSVFVLLLSFCPSLVWLPFVVLFLALFVLVSLCFLFPLRYIRKKERARRVGASSLRMLWVVCLLCKIRFAVRVKFEVVSLNIFGDTFIGNSIFVIIPPLFEKTFEDTLDKIPCVKFVFHALFYVV